MADDCEHPNKQYDNKSVWINGWGLCLSWTCPDCGSEGFKEIEPRNNLDQAIYDVNTNPALPASATILFMEDNYQDD